MNLICITIFNLIKRFVAMEEGNFYLSLNHFAIKRRLILLSNDSNKVVVFIFSNKSYSFF